MSMLCASNGNVFPFFYFIQFSNRYGYGFAPTYCLRTIEIPMGIIFRFFFFTKRKIRSTSFPATAKRCIVSQSSCSYTPRIRQFSTCTEVVVVERRARCRRVVLWHFHFDTFAPFIIIKIQFALAIHIVSPSYIRRIRATFYQVFA